ncbi:MAG: fasciclin domain-containing protein [Candidatus Nanopelagicales bacterium]|nr:fasciclin domain-containing protein [Candidatus Nanopelagicales bacterium]
MRTKISRAAVAGTAALIGLAALAPTAQAAEGETSLATVLKVGQSKFDRDYADFDILTKAVETVLGAKPNSNVKLLAYGMTALTVFAPTDQAFMNLATTLSGKKVKTEAAAFKVVAGLGVDTVENVLLYHVVPGSTILSQDALKANGAKLKSAVEGKLLVSR